jgi:FixJ family two-component response regulator
MLVAVGRLNKQVAADLGIAEKTVKAHRARVMAKLGASSVADLVRIVERASKAAP